MRIQSAIDHQHSNNHIHVDDIREFREYSYCC